MHAKEKEDDGEGQSELRSESGREKGRGEEEATNERSSSIEFPLGFRLDGGSGLSEVLAL